MPYHPIKRQRVSAATLRQMLTAKQVQQLLGFRDIETVYRLAKYMEVPCMKVSGQWRFPAYFDRWLEQEMVRQMYARKHWRRPDDGHTHPPRDFGAGEALRAAKAGMRWPDLGVQPTPQPWHDDIDNPWAPRRRNQPY